LGHDLINGLSFLHTHGVAHRNVKPSNLVYTADYRLQIIDFDVAVYVTGEDDAVEGFCGSEGWTAPEVGDGCAYSTVRADRWACGRVL
ncbi:kinase-like domain-containing protein, partial [Fomitopsis serialis]|uniref:kinase-like domain-containing protein n=1 Tax=Fomitopsis serialis TaxID=139415 RepID=UPI002007E9D6